MTTSNYTNLIESLKTIKRGNSESDNRKGRDKAYDLIEACELSDDDKKSIQITLCKAANPSGYYFDNNGVNAAIETIKTLRANITASKRSLAETAPNTSKNDRVRSEYVSQSQNTFNRRNLKNLVSDGKIFSIEFIKRSTGELRTMTARVGVKKHLKHGLKAYNPAQHNLLTVFDMEAKGYRSIPVEAIQRLSIGGQTFNFAGV